MVGDFTPGAEYPLMPVGDLKAGVFICFESAFPDTARKFTEAGADVLINISNDGYLGPTPVVRQHLANAIFRAVENGRPVLRVTNTGITTYITPRGQVTDATGIYRTDVRTWTVNRSDGTRTFYTNYGDTFVEVCTAFSLLVLLLSLFRRAKRISQMNLEANES
jgi:apolipoprotein N-acyltransferase